MMGACCPGRGASILETALLAWLPVPCALLPILGFLWLMWWLDRFDREPLGLFGLAFAWGAVGAIAITLAGDELLAAPLARALGVVDVHRLQVVVLAPLLEEPAKALILLLLVRTSRFDSTTDGFVFGAAAGLGFGMSENLIYFRSAAGGGDDALFAGILALRTLYSALMHAAATAAIGAALGYVKFRNGRRRVAVPVAGLVVALAIHTLWNGLLLAALDGRLALGLLDLVLFPIEFGVLFILFQLALLDERRIIGRELLEEVELGVIPADHLAFLAAYARRARPDWLPTNVDGRLYIRRATALAFRKHQLQVNVEPGFYADEVTRLRRELVQQLNAAGLAPAHIPALDWTSPGS
jgi:protease PrsW